MADPEAVARRYLEHLTVERGLADNTLAAYRRDLERYVGVPPRRGRFVRLDDVDAKTIRAFIASVSASTHGPDAEPYHGDDGVADAVDGADVPSVRAARRACRTTTRPRASCGPGCPRALPHPLTVDEVTAIDRGARGRDPGGGARPRDPRAPLRSGPARLGARGAGCGRRRPGGGRRSGCSARGARSALVPVGRMARDAVARLPRARASGARDGALARGAVPERARRSAHAPVLLASARRAPRAGRASHGS